ncbi:DUF6682 family protein [Desulfocurvibacter africanus]|uniref:phage adaptor protein n=2 Tax=Desulfocurvibacter africanus TaxID=873 RepID=UPI0003FBAA94|nr:DUF6682 family protein [Desulfocurvibacter africanus]
MSVITLAGSQTRSSSLASDIIRRVRQKLNESSAHFWSDEELLQWINEGCLDIAAKTLCVGASEEIMLAADTLEYALTSPHLTAIAAVYDNRKGLMRGDPRQVGHVRDVGEPVHWYPWDGFVGVYPVPAGGSPAIGRRVRIYLVDMPAQLAAADPIPTPAIFDGPLVNYVCAEAWFKDDKAGKGSYRLSLYEGVIAQFRADFGDRGRDRPADLGSK